MVVQPEKCENAAGYKPNINSIVSHDQKEIMTKELIQSWLRGQQLKVQISHTEF